MTFQELKSAVLNLSLQDQKRFITEVLPEIWPKACSDESCYNSMKHLLDDDTIKRYKEEHLDHI